MNVALGQWLSEEKARAAAAVAAAQRAFDNLRPRKRCRSPDATDAEDEARPLSPLAVLTDSGDPSAAATPVHRSQPRSSPPALPQATPPPSEAATPPPGSQAPFAITVSSSSPSEASDACHHHDDDDDDRTPLPPVPPVLTPLEDQLAYAPPALTPLPTAGAALSQASRGSHASNAGDVPRPAPRRPTCIDIDSSTTTPCSRPVLSAPSAGRPSQHALGPTPPQATPLRASPLGRSTAGTPAAWGWDAEVDCTMADDDVYPLAQPSPPRSHGSAPTPPPLLRDEDFTVGDDDPQELRDAAAALRRAKQVHRHCAVAECAVRTYGLPVMSPAHLLELPGVTPEMAMAAADSIAEDAPAAQALLESEEVTELCFGVPAELAELLGASNTAARRCGRRSAVRPLQDVAQGDPTPLDQFPLGAFGDVGDAEGSLPGLSPPPTQDPSPLSQSLAAPSHDASQMLPPPAVAAPAPVPAVDTAAIEKGLAALAARHLRVLCGSWGTPTSGTKPVLIQRLVAAAVARGLSFAALAQPVSDAVPLLAATVHSPGPRDTKDATPSGDEGDDERSRNAPPAAAQVRAAAFLGDAFDSLLTTLAHDAPAGQRPSKGPAAVNIAPTVGVVLDSRERVEGSAERFRAVVASAGSDAVSITQRTLPIGDCAFTVAVTRAAVADALGAAGRTSGRRGAPARAVSPDAVARVVAALGPAAEAEAVLPVVVERKRLDDLAKSVVDSRYAVQKALLRRCVAEAATRPPSHAASRVPSLTGTPLKRPRSVSPPPPSPGLRLPGRSNESSASRAPAQPQWWHPRVVYLLEGDPASLTAALGGDVSSVRQRVASAAVSTMVHDGFCVARVPSQEGAARWLRAMAAHLREIVGEALRALLAQLLSSPAPDLALPELLSAAAGAALEPERYQRLQLQAAAAGSVVPPPTLPGVEDWMLRERTRREVLERGLLFPRMLRVVKGCSTELAVAVARRYRSLAGLHDALRRALAGEDEGRAASGPRALTQAQQEVLREPVARAEFLIAPLSSGGRQDKHAAEASLTLAHILAGATYGTGRLTPRAHFR